MKSKALFFSFKCAFVLFFLGLQGTSVSAEMASEWVKSDVASARLVSAGSDSVDDNQILLGLQIQLKEGWKTYWRSPGDSGIPPRFNWQGSQNVGQVKVHWPVPQGFSSFGFMTWGYGTEVIFPLVITRKAPSKPVVAQLSFEYGVCEEICIPLSQTFRLELPANNTGATEFSDQVQMYVEKSPVNLRQSDAIEAVTASALKGAQFKLDVSANEKITDPVLILEGEDGDVFNVQGVSISSDHQQASFLIEADVVRKSPSLSGRVLFATIFDDGWAVEAVLSIK
jgi:suppressor for copper-sensitivity B